MLQFEQSIVPLLDRRGNLPPPPAGFTLPPPEEMQIALVPASEYLYFLQNILYPDSLAKAPDGNPPYTVYSLFSWSKS
jgi:hypothetical protein